MNRKVWLCGIFVLAATSFAQSKDLGFSWSRWSVAAQDVLFDNSSGLQWTRNDNGNGIDWNSARRYCGGLILAGEGWRLPNMSELDSIYDQSASPIACGHEYGDDNLDSCKTSSLFRLTGSSFWGAGTKNQKAEFVSFSSFHLKGWNSPTSTVGRALCVRP